MKKVISICLIFSFLTMGAFARKTDKADKSKYLAKINHEYNVFDSTPDVINFNTNEAIKVDENLTIEKGTPVSAQVMEFQRARRWHKSGFIVCKILSYEKDGKTVDIQDKDIHFVVSKYEKLNPKEAAIITTELVVFTGAAFFAPGVDIGYFFTKGAIQRQKHYNWFKAGVHNAYDNSILWLILKGKPIKLAANDEIRLKPITRENAHNISARVEYRKHKASFKKEKAFERQEIKEIKKELKLEEKIAKNPKKADKLLAKFFDRKIRKKYKLEQRFARAQLREEHKQLEDEITQIRYELRKEQKQERRLARKIQKNSAIVALDDDNSIDETPSVIELHAAGKILLDDYHEQPIDYIEHYMQEN